ncbi:MAG: hypothetical protein ACI8UX_000855 [Psychromonas sp.]
MKFHLLVLFFFPLLVFAERSGPEETYTVIQNLGENWYTFNEDSKEYFPYIKNIGPRHKAHTTFLNINENKNFSLVIKSLSKDSHLFLNGQFYKELVKGKWLVIPVKDLTYTEEVLAITFYGSTNIKAKTIFVGVKSSLDQSNNLVQSHFLGMKLRQKLLQLDTYIILLGFIFIFISILSYVNPKAFAEYFSISDIFIMKLRDTKFLVSKPLNQINISFLILLSMITSLLYVLLMAKGVPLFENKLGFEISIEKTSVALTFLKATMIAFAIYLLKFLFLKITGNLFSLGKSVNIHHFKIIQFSLFFFLLLALTLFAFVISDSNMSIATISRIAFWIAILVYTSRTLIVFLSILKSTGIQSLYLFAYLCIVEILPIFLGIRFVL